MTVQLTGDWKKFQSVLDPAAFQQRFLKTMGRATALNAQRYVEAIQMSIRNKEFAKNADLTVKLKGSDVPLVNGGNLIEAITFKMIGPQTAFVGLIRATAGEKAVNLGIVLHEGTSIKVTDKMRAFFFFNWVFHPEKGWKPLKPTTKVIVLPKRPFIEKTFKRKDLVKIATLEWQKAAQGSFAI